jgi:hypothetical protein
MRVSIATLAAPPAPVVTAAHLRYLKARSFAVVVQDATGRVTPLPLLTDEQREDADLVVLLEHDQALAYLLEAEGKAADAAMAVTADLAGQQARGLL